MIDTVRPLCFKCDVLQIILQDSFSKFADYTHMNNKVIYLPKLSG